jgi:hypothetical protein
MSFPPSAVETRLQAARGYLSLGMAHAAWLELEKIDKSERVNFVAIWKVEAEAARALGNWRLVAELARHLSKLEPDEPRHAHNLDDAMSQIAETRTLS